MATEPKKITPAYVAFETFRNFIEALHKTALPNHIDKSLMINLSNGVQSHLMSTLRFLGLTTGENNQVTEQMRQLVSSFDDQQGWSPALAEVLRAAYGGIIGELDIAKASVKQLDDAFRNTTGFEGTMLERAIRFYIKGLREANVSFSPHLGKRKPRTPGGRTNGKNPKAPAETRSTEHGTETNGDKRQSAPPQPPPPAPGTISFPIYFRGKPTGSLIVPADLAEEDVRMVELMIPMLQAYAGVSGRGEH